MHSDKGKGARQVTPVRHVRSCLSVTTGHTCAVMPVRVTSGSCSPCMANQYINLGHTLLYIIIIYFDDVHKCAA